MATGFKVWRGKHKPTNQHYGRVRRINPRRGNLTPFKSWEDREYVEGKHPPHYPVPVNVSHRTTR